MSRNDISATAQRIAARLTAGARVLEVATGPGYLAIEVARLCGAPVDALDISRTFVSIATRNAQQAGVQVNVRHGDVHVMPWGDGTFDCLVCRAAFKNFSRPDVALREMRRVLKPDGQALIIDMRREVSNEEIDAAVASMATSRMSTWVIGRTFKGMLRRRAYGMEALRDMALAAGFTRCDIAPVGIGFEAWLDR
jgi:ubiquinone/menaquinone biosynthesis C-methylase UbiE